MKISGRYEIAGDVLRGGMSEVHIARDMHLDRKVVLKCLQPFQEQRRIVDEQKALLQVQSKHVVQLLDVVQNELAGQVQNFLVIDFIDGDDLREFQFETDKNYLRTLWQIAAGLADVHGFGVIHRDIKPGNIRMDTEKVVKIFDFGLARRQGVDNKTRGPIGTDRYMAPELLSDHTVNFSTSADVYSFGVTALTLLNRPPPRWCIQSPTIPAPINAVELHAPELSDEIKHILQLCLSTDHYIRPTMLEVKIIIEKVLLFNAHSAQLILAGTLSEIDKNRQTAFPRVYNKITNETISALRIHYTGSQFTVTENIGRVTVNNSTIQIGDILSPSCVIGFPRTDSARPFFATFNVSQPEVFV